MIFGAVHSGVALAAMPMMNAMHPRVAAEGPDARPGEVGLPRFGFGGRGFGAMTPVGIVMGHLVFGIVWGSVFWALA